MLNKIEIEKTTRGYSLMNNYKVKKQKFANHSKSSSVFSLPKKVNHHLKFYSNQFLEILYDTSIVLSIFSIFIYCKINFGAVQFTDF